LGRAYFIVNGVGAVLVMIEPSTTFPWGGLHGIEQKVRAPA
jgi:hypothetical protein